MPPQIRCVARPVGLLRAAIAFLAGTAGCGSPDETGDACQSDKSCRSGLVCSTAHVCEPGNMKSQADSCFIADECSAGLSCLDGECERAGRGRVGVSCSDDRDCAARLRCSVELVSPTCGAEGGSDLYQPCQTNGDCFQGLACEDDSCVVSTGEPWRGVACSASSDPRPRAYFEVAGAAEAEEGDFFRLPFPNDARRGPSGLDLSGFPTPGTYQFGVDPVQVYVDAIMANETAWGTYPTVTFRFSADVQVEQSNLRWVDVTPGAPEYGSAIEFVFEYTSERSAYVCENSLAMRPAQGKPLLPDHTYALWVDHAVESNGAKVRAAPNFTAVLGVAVPTDASLLPVYTAYTPFRNYLADTGLDPTSILVASVVTTSNPHQVMAALADAIALMPAPTAHDWVRCGDGAVSPCPEHDGDRNCGALNPDYDEYDALVSLPIFQTGTAPYFVPSEGGDIDPSLRQTADVCMAITVPTGEMPPAGWPLVIYAHGTGGSYREHADATIGGAFATSAVPTAVLGIDQVEHGTRRGGWDLSPDDLFYNFLNPKVGRGNPLQGAADQLSLARFAAQLSLTAEESGGAAFEVDPNAIAFFGHSQGSTEGSLMLPFGDTFKAALLSGNGAGLVDALLTKTNPVDIASYIPRLVQDGQLSELGHFHPVLALLQEWVDPADPLNFAIDVTRRPIDGHLPKHVFQTYGLNDTFAPPVTLATFAIAGDLTEVTPDESVADPDPIGSLAAVQSPLVGNVESKYGRFTLGVREYAPPEDADGHFVVYKTPSAHADAIRFLNMALAGNVPQIGPSE